MSVRGFVERLSRGIVLRRRLPSAFGGHSLWVSPEGGGLRYWRLSTAKMDPHLFRSVDRLVEQGSSVWDVGANMGLFAFSAAHRAGPSGYVLAIEPDVDIVSLMLQSRAAMLGASVAQVDIIPCAVNTEGAGFAEFEISSRARSANSLKGAGLSQKGAVRETRLVPLVSLDGLLGRFRSPDVVKIDVEGAEVSALSGASRILSDVRPVLVIEVEQEASEQVELLLTRHDYAFFDGDAPGDRWVATQRPTWNCHAIPRERTGRYVAPTRASGT